MKAAKHYLASLVENKSFIVNRYASDVTLLLFDRSVDAVTPLMHGFSYEAMLFDLMKISYESKDQLQDKECYSFEEIQDEVYDQFRYKHISYVL